MRISRGDGVEIDVVSLFPEFFGPPVRCGMTGRAMDGGQLELRLWNPRDFATDRHRSVDDRPYGGGPGMVMRIEPLAAAITAARQASPPPARVIYLTPQGRRLDHAGVQALARVGRLILVAGRYEGVDERLIEAEVDEEWSIGDFVLSGGEVAALALIEAVARLLPGVLGNADSVRQDSFAQGLLACAQYTRPEELGGRRVPAVLLSGDHGAIRRWRLKQALGRTWLRRPDLLAGRRLNEEQQCLLDEFRAERAEPQERSDE